MNARTVVLAVLWAMLAWYGWLRIVLGFTLICVGIFVGTMVLFGIADAIRTRNDPRPRPPIRPQAPRDDEDEELAQLRRMAGLAGGKRVSETERS
jgi:hypothetical protein